MQFSARLELRTIKNFFHVVFTVLVFSVFFLGVLFFTAMPQGFSEDAVPTETKPPSTSKETRFQKLFFKKQTDTSERYQVQAGDTLGKIAKKYSTTIELIRKANKIKKDVVWEGMKLKVEKTPFSVEISILKNVLLLKQGEHELKEYRVSTGENGNTPVGVVKVVNKVINPAWYYEDDVILPGDPKNGLGTRWMGFDLKGYGIHGTIEPEKIGKPASLGCVRMRNEDVEELFDLIPIGTPVTIGQ